MAEQQLVDYIQKARQAGQADDQTRNLLYKNGWTEAEVSDAFASIVEQPKPQPQPEPQIQQQPKPEELPQTFSQPKVQPQPQIEEKPEPQYQPQYQPQTTSSMPKTKKSHLVLKLIIALVILAIVAGAGYFIAGQYLNLPWNFSSFFGPSPETVIKNMLANMKNVKSYNTTIHGQADAQDSTGTSQGKLSFDASGGSDITDDANPKGNFTFTINLALSAPASLTASAKAEMIFANNAIYLKLDDLTLPAEYAQGVDISQIQGKWLKFDQDSAKVLSGAGAEDVSFSQAGSQQLAVKIQDLISTENVFSVTKQFSGQAINGQNTYHYLVTINNNKLKDLVDKVIDLQTQGATNTEDTTAFNNVAMLKVFANSFIGNIGDLNIEMWIGKKDYMLYESQINKTIDLSKIIPGANAKVAVKLNINESDFNKPITVQEPADAQKIENFILPMIKTQKITSDLSQVGSVARTVFSTTKSYATLCRAGLLSGYLKMGLLGISNDIVSQGAKIPVCFASVSNYCVSTQLADGSYLCVGASSNSGQANCLGGTSGENCISVGSVIGKTKCISAQTVCQPVGIQ